ncbi:CDP-alcohol phosphatidyltransferase family protein [Natronospirillum operosum]|uniref:CDP-alcohol phosphatidyltransferase family protein n=1 Tax=Natronospirillum operosum TaxID=2759953 RepID=A0A4Z0WB18_9GAMM|nr:CDP-alcohol phosphatidyltransferase family protein [Natronospirillum operosum]TGG95849.1 CDP-alcohol phosphatidyltransferase family protein [Natronospirillum operosum]
MLDRYVLPVLKPGLRLLARPLRERGVTADQVTVAGFAIGLLAVPLIMLNAYWLALICIVLNRVADGIDGELARLDQPSDAGGYLDITLDFIFYQAVVFAFALADPANTVWALLLMLSFVGTGVSFLAFAALAEKHRIESPAYPNKSMHYLGGLAEGTETILVFVAFCIWPRHFPVIAAAFAALCVLTTVMRLVYGHRTLRQAEQAESGSVD